MQPFDALTIRAVLQECKPLLVNRKVDKVFQLARDEILINLRSKGGNVSVFLSAQSVYGRMCLVRIPSSADTAAGNPRDRSIYERYRSKYGSSTPPQFCVTLRKNLHGATLVGVEQIPGERIVDFVFSCVDEVGSTSLKVLTAEIMGRHSNLIFWNKESKKILAASHVVTKDMSRQREVLPNLQYERPPGQERPNIFFIKKDDLKEPIEVLKSSQSPDDEKGEDKPVPATLEQWLLSSFTGLGKYLSEEVIAGTGLTSKIDESIDVDQVADKVWLKVEELQAADKYSPKMRVDLSRYSLLSWYPDMEDETAWTDFGTVNELVESYFRSLEAREHYIQLREKIKAEINSESQKLDARKEIAESHLAPDSELSKLKVFGDMILSNLSSIEPGQAALTVDSWETDNGESREQVIIELNPNLTSVQNAQAYYRRYAKSRARQGAAQSTVNEVSKRLDVLDKLRQKVQDARDIAELRKIKESMGGRRPQERKERSGQRKPKGKGRLLSLTSSDGWTIYVGRNRHENDHLVNKIANPNDLWLHVLGQGGAHVLIRVPQSKQDPPKNTLIEAAQVAARLSKASLGSKCRVVYTRCKYVKKVDKKKPGVVRYENEKTIEVDTARPMPKLMKKLFR